MGRIKSMAAGAALLGMGALGMYVAAGPLNPPGGPVASSYKTLSEIEPRVAVNAANTPGDASNLYIISQPGSYYLTGNVLGVSGKAGIRITASDVTLDLCGFALIGGTGTTQGVATANAVSRVTLRRGSARDWAGAYTIDLTTCTGALVEDLQVSTTGSVALLAGANARVLRCFVSGATQFGISSPVGGTLSECVALNCLTGLSSLRGNVTGCSAVGCSGAGIVAVYGTVSDCEAILGGDGIMASQGAAVSGCVAYSCSNHGLACASGATLEHCSAYTCAIGFSLGGSGIARGCVALGSDGDGFVTSDEGNIMESCSSNRNGTVAHNGAGFNVASNDQIVGCTADLNVGDGIRCLDGCTIRGCSSTNNNVDGIHVQFGCTVRSCTSRANQQDGIESAAGGMIVDNLCDGNGVAGAGYSCILLTGYGARVEGNSLIGATYGVRATSSSNVVARNTCKNSTTPFGGIVAGNDVGPVGSAATSASPWGNIVY